MPILIGPACASTCRSSAGAAISAEPASVPSSTLRRVMALTRYFCFVVTISSLVFCSMTASVPGRRPCLFELHGVEFRRQDDLEQLAVVGIVEHGVLDLRRLQPGS